MSMERMLGLNAAGGGLGTGAGGSNVLPESEAHWPHAHAGPGRAG